MIPAELAPNLQESRPVIIQGPVGTVLGQDHLPPSIHELIRLDNGQQALRSVHENYAQNGASFLVAHTFGSQAGREPSLTQTLKQQSANIEQAVAVAAGVAKEYGLPIGASVSSVGDCYKPTEGIQLDRRELVSWQRRHLRLLQNGGAEFAIAETFPSWHEISALAEAAAAEGMEYGLSLYLVKDDVGRLRLPHDYLRQPESESDGPLLTDVAAILDSLPKKPKLIAANCIPLEYAVEAVADISSIESEILIGIWPNGDGTPDNTPADMLASRIRQGKEQLLPTLRECYIGGAAIIGGCCRTDYEDTAAIRRSAQLS